MTYREALEYIHSREAFGSRPGLDRIKRLCELLGNPQNNTGFVHIAGTNGKGSVCAMLSSILRCAGLRVGLYTSPYISFFEERIKINGEPISKERLAEIIEKVKIFADKTGEEITEFEVITAAAFVCFSEEKCDIAVLETGLGGRLDATNIINSPLLSVITGIALDHTAVLGETVEKIAYEKGGIIKEGCPVVIAACPAGAKKVLKNISSNMNAPLTEADYRRITNKRFSPYGAGICVKPYGDIELSLAGIYQADNAAVAITAAEALKNAGIPVDKAHIINGLKKTVWPARFEVLSKSPFTVYDGAHNENGAMALAENIKEILGGKVVLLTGVMADKNYRKIAEILSPFIKEAFTVTPDNHRALSARNLADTFASFGIKATACESISDGVAKAGEKAKKEALPLVICGTLYMYKQISDIMR